MAQRPMMWHDPADPGRSADASLSSGVASCQQRDDGVPLEHLADLLKRSGKAVSATSPPLHVKLAQIAEEACLVTAATGAAIALKQDQEFVCCASWGTQAPPSGAHLSTDSGLSGRCVRERQAQRCDDTETDPRVDAIACRQLQVRSLLVLPLLKGEELLGIFEVLSSHARAFGIRDFEILYTLCRSIIEEIEHPSENPAPPAVSPSAESASAPNAPSPADLLSAASVPPQVPAQAQPSPVISSTPQNEPSSASPIEATTESPVLLATPPEPFFQAESPTATDAPARRDRTTTILVALVITLTVLLGWMIGFGWRRRSGAEQTRAALSTPSGPNSSPIEKSDGTRQNPPAPHVVQVAPAPPTHAPDKAARPHSPPALVSRREKGPEPAAPSGGLVVYQEGRVIFRQASPPAPGLAGSSSKGVVASASPAMLSPEQASAHLLQRVEPHYPESARKQHIQGPVVLDVLVGRDGAVEQLRAIRGNNELVNAAAEAVRQWRFRPYAPEGKAVEFTTRLTVNFVLQNAADN